LRLGWLINPQDRQVEVPTRKAVEVIQMPAIVAGRYIAWIWVTTLGKRSALMA